jgi:hypothetical protein
MRGHKVVDVRCIRTLVSSPLKVIKDTTASTTVAPGRDGALEF